MFTDTINRYVKEESEKLSVFQQGGVYLATKKIGKNNPKAEEIKADNAARQEWNRTVDVALVEGVPEEDILKIKQEKITDKTLQSIRTYGWLPDMFRQIIRGAKDFLQEVIFKLKLPPKPVPKIDLKRKCDAQDWERAFKLKENRSLDMTFGDFVNIYLNDIKPRIKYNTWLTKKHIVDKNILPYFTDRKLQEIKTADIRQWQNMIMNHRDANGKGYSQVYLKTIHNQMSAILNHAVNFYDLKSNVARKAGSMGKEKSKEMLFWTKEEYTQFIEAVADKPISFYAFEIFYWCGLRMGELLALTPADLDFRFHTIRINKSY